MKSHANMNTLQLHQVISLRDTKGRRYNLSPDEKVPHMIDMNRELVARNPEPQPRMDIKIQVDVAAYQQFGLECKLGKQFTDRKGRPQN